MKAAAYGGWQHQYRSGIVAAAYQPQRHIIGGIENVTRNDVIAAAARNGKKWRARQA